MERPPTPWSLAAFVRWRPRFRFAALALLASVGAFLVVAAVLVFVDVNVTIGVAAFVVLVLLFGLLVARATRSSTD